MGNSTVPPPKKMGTVPTSKQPTILGYQNITFDSFILILYSSNITCDDSFVTFGGSLIFFLTINDFILTWCSFNITCDSSFVTFCSSLIFLSYSTVLFSHYAVATSQLTVLLSHLVVFFLTFDGSIFILCNSNIICNCSFVTFGGSFFFLTFNGSIVTFSNTNTTFDNTFVTFSGFFFFSHIL